MKNVYVRKKENEMKNKGMKSTVTENNLLSDDTLRI